MRPGMVRWQSLAYCSGLLNRRPFGVRRFKSFSYRHRSICQFGRRPHLGCGGHWFKSNYFDQLPSWLCQRHMRIFNNMRCLRCSMETSRMHTMFFGRWGYIFDEQQFSRQSTDLIRRESLVQIQSTQPTCSLMWTLIWSIRLVVRIADCLSADEDSTSSQTAIYLGCLQR